VIVGVAAASAAAWWITRERPLPSVLLVTIDTLRADHVGAYGSNAGATPNIDRFARDAVLFETAITPAPLTLPAHTALLSGVLPLRSGVRVNGTDVVSTNVPLLAPEMAGAGYATAAFVSSLVLRRQSGIGRGFSLYDDQFEANAGKDPREQVPERRGDETVDRALAWLDSRRRERDAAPFFVWVHLYDPHAPYEPPAPFADAFKGREYDGEIAAADAAFARLLAGVDPNRTLVVLAGDHGEGLGEHGEATHGVFLYDATLRVPLLFRLPRGRHGGTRVAAQVRLTDVAPTLRALARLPASASSDLDGEDLSPLFLAARQAPDRPAFSQSDYPAFVLGWSPLRAMRFHGRKYVEAPRRELYDLARDPKELRNRYGSEDEETRDLARRMVTVLSKQPLAEATSSAVDPEVARRLASLGYISGGAATVDYDRIDASRVDPKDHIDIWSQIESGLIARQKKKYEAAVAVFERLLSSYPSINPVILRDYAEACRFTGRTDRAIELYRQVLKTSKPEPDDFFGLGVSWHLKGNERAACESFERAVAMNPSDMSAWIDLGNGRLALDQLDPAGIAFQRAADLDARSVDALNGLASVAFERHDLPAAEAMLRKAEAVAPERVDTRFNLAKVAAASGQSGAARAIYETLQLHRDPRVVERARRELERLH
jgi:arylsulfatase A-like enzyme